MRLYCINLRRAAERRLRMQGEFERLKLPVEFIDAIDGQALSRQQLSTSYSRWRTMFRCGRGLTCGEIGCALSHIEFFKRIVESGEIGFVFEDDVTLSPDVQRGLNAVEKFLMATKEPCIARLPGLPRDTPTQGSHDNAFVLTPKAVGTYAYGVNPQAALLLSRVYSPIMMPIDRYRYVTKHFGLNCHTYRSQVLTVDMDGPSTIGSNRFLGDNGVVTRVAFKAWRLIGTPIDALLRLILGH